MHLVSRLMIVPARCERGEHERKVRSAALDVLRSASFVSLLLPATACPRGAPAPTRHPIRNDEFRMLPLLNSTLKFIMDVNRGAIRAGCAGRGLRIVMARRPKRI